MVGFLNFLCEIDGLRVVEVELCRPIRTQLAPAPSLPMLDYVQDMHVKKIVFL